MAGETKDDVIQQDEGAGDPPDEGFGDAFAEASEEKPAGEKTTEVKGEEKKTDEEIKAEEKEAEAEIKKEEEIKKPEEKVDTAESLEQKYKTLQGMYHQLLGEKGEKPPEKKEEAEAPPPDYSILFTDLQADLADEVKAELSEYEEEYDHISKFEGIKREQLAKRLIGLMNVSFQKFREQIAPYLQATAETAQSNHYTSIKAAHDDFEEIRDSGKMSEWIESKPKYMRAAMQGVYKGGETQDVIDLFQQFKEETGYKPGSKKTAGKKKNDDSSDSLELVKTRETGIPPAPRKANQVKEDDFSGAFAEAVEVSARKK